MSNEIDLEYRPATYFQSQGLQDALLRAVKGDVARQELMKLLRDGRHEEALRFAAMTSEGNRKALEAIHPMFMGGNYLQDAGSDEVELARIAIQSTTYDVTCVYVQHDRGVHRYRAVDEYDGDTLQEPTVMESDGPLTLAELANFFLHAWPLTDVLKMNFPSDIEGQLGFFRAESSFYPDLDRLCRQRVIEEFQRPHPGGDQSSE